MLVEGVPLVLGPLLREFCHSGYEYLTRRARRSKCAPFRFNADRSTARLQLCNFRHEVSSFLVLKMRLPPQARRAD